MRKLLLQAIGIILSGTLLAADPPELTWQLGYKRVGIATETGWIQAVVPGAVQLDIARAEGYGPYYFAENWKDYLWMEDREFYYRALFPQTGTGTG